MRRSDAADSPRAKRSKTMVRLPYSLKIALYVLITIFINNVNGQCGSYFFVTPQPYAPGANWDNAVTGTRFNSIVEADSICQFWASRSVLPVIAAGTYKAVLSDSNVDAKTRFGYTDLDICLPDGTTVVARNTQNMFSDLNDRVNDADQNQDATVTGNLKVFTGSQENGEVVMNAHCSDWSSDQGNGQNGKTDQKNNRFLADGTVACNIPSRLFCMEVVPVGPPQSPCRRMFVTSTSTAGDFGVEGQGTASGAVGADAACDAASKNANALPSVKFYVTQGYTEYKAIFAHTGVNAFTRVGLDTADCAVLVDDTLLWDGTTGSGGESFWLSEGLPINVDEQGGVAMTERTWTNSDALGERVATMSEEGCNWWRSNMGPDTARYGKTDKIDHQWISSNTAACDNTYRFYCVSVPLPTTTTTAPPTNVPTAMPTMAPAGTPTKMPTDAPITKTEAPTTSPTKSPTDAPTHAPTKTPTRQPTKAPTVQPSEGPTVTPGSPSQSPTKRPTNAPSTTPTRQPTNAPSVSPTRRPTQAPLKASEISSTSATVAMTGGGTSATTPNTGIMSTSVQTGASAGSSQNIVPNSTTVGETDSMLMPILIGIGALLCVCLIILCLFLLLRRRRRNGHIRDFGTASGTVRSSARHSRRSHARHSKRMSSRYSRGVADTLPIVGGLGAARTSEDGTPMGVQWLAPSARASASSDAAKAIYGRAPHIATSQPTASVSSGIVYESLPNGGGNGGEIVYETLPDVDGKGANKGKPEIIYSGFGAATQTELRVPKSGAI